MIRDAKALADRAAAKFKLIGKVSTERTIERSVNLAIFLIWMQTRFCPPSGMSEAEFQGISFTPAISIGLNTGKSPGPSKFPALHLIWRTFL